ncbi:MAG: hypothetical protein ACRDQI_06110 [Pseudonocardiaceae bacterium]
MSTVHEADDQGPGDGPRNVVHDAEGFPHDDSNDQRQPTQPAGEHGIQPTAAMPPTVLVTEMDNGAVILQGRPDGPRVYLSRADAVPLKRELAAAFGSTERALSSGNRDDAR